MPLKPLEIQQCQNQDSKDPFVDPRDSRIGEIVSHVDGKRRNAEQEVIFFKIDIQIKRSRGQYQHKEKKLKRFSDMNNTLEEVLAERQQKENKYKSRSNQHQVVVQVDIQRVWKRTGKG